MTYLIGPIVVVLTAWSIATDYEGTDWTMFWIVLTILIAPVLLLILLTLAAFGVIHLVHG